MQKDYSKLKNKLQELKDKNKSLEDRLPIQNEERIKDLENELQVKLKEKENVIRQLELDKKKKDVFLNIILG